MTTTRREVLGLMSASVAFGLGAPGIVLGQSKRMLNINILGNSLAIHVPAIAALNEGLPALGYPAPKLTRIDSMQVNTQSIIGRSAEIGEADISSTLQASVAGADLRVIGLVYANTSLVWVVNADTIKDYADFVKPGVIVATNSKGDWIHAMLNGPLMKRGVDPNKVQIVEIGGSAGRVQALLSGRAHAVPVHIDQTPGILDKGNYKIMIRPWEEFKVYIAECWIASGEWLKNPDNQRAAVDLQKATITSFRKANRDLAYFTQIYRKYSTIKDAASKTEESLKGVWELMSKTVKAWPDDGMFKREYFAELLPTYKTVGGFPRDPNLNVVVDPTYVERALKELA
jgi:NitT/TauT family transport system substrate-binding protein